MSVTSHDTESKILLVNYPSMQLWSVSRQSTYCSHILKTIEDGVNVPMIIISFLSISPGYKFTLQFDLTEECPYIEHHFKSANIYISW